MPEKTTTVSPGDIKLEKLLQEASKDVNYPDFLTLLWNANDEITSIIKNTKEIDDARMKIFEYAEKREREFLINGSDLNQLESYQVRESLKVLKNVIAPVNEKATETSALTILWNLAHDKYETPEKEAEIAFLIEFIFLLRSVAGNTKLYEKDIYAADETVPSFLNLKGREAATARMQVLDKFSEDLKGYFDKYPSGFDKDTLERREENKKRILDYFDATEEDWNDYKWHLKKTVMSAKPVMDLIDLDEDYQAAVTKAIDYKVPFGVTPYYIGLMDKDYKLGYDHAVRAQVLPPKAYVDEMVTNRENVNTLFDFMGEHDTSPIDLITRRYPMIAILKPYNTCAQICVYCQRNWEITGCLDPNAMASKETIKEALKWFDEHPGVGDVLITGGDPLIMNDASIRYLLEEISKKKHVYRVRFGTRTPVVLPQRWTDSLIDVLKEFRDPPNLEIAIITHFIHSYEVTPEAMEAIQKIRKAGIGVYNQEVFTIDNSRRFESVKLRRDMRSIGVDPYYTFNMKGKGETRDYMVPIARILQERKEEARLLPGLDRTDEPVFNVPRMGKNHLRAWQDHKLIMIKPDGSRVYEFHPWEKNIAAVPTYDYTDIPIYNYLQRLLDRGEDPSEYQSLYYYY